MFAPVLNNIGPSLVQSGFQNAAGMKLDGAQALAAGIQSAGQSLGGGIAKGLGSALDDMRAKGEMQTQDAAKAGAWLESGLVDKNPKLRTVFETAINEKDPVKRNAMMQVGDALVEMEMGNRRMNAQYNGAANLAAFKQTLPQAAAKPRVVNAMDGIYSVGANNVATPITGPDGKPLKPRAAADPFAGIFGGTPVTPPAAVASPSSTPAAAPAATPAGSGGYVPGKRYGGRLYLGGNHMDPASWE